MKRTIIRCIRTLLMHRPLRDILRVLTYRRGPHDLVSRIAPPNTMFDGWSPVSFTADGFKYYLPLSEYMAHYLYFGFYDASIIELYDKVNDNDVVFDIGANIGSTSLHFARDRKGTIVHAFEPDPSNYELAHHHIKLNNISNVSLYKTGLGSKPEKVKLFVAESHNRGMNRILHAPANNMAYSEINIERLDDVVANINPTKIDLIKIDVEGYEMQVLLGGESTIEKFAPRIFMEANNMLLQNHGASISDIVAFLQEYDYQLFRIPGNTPITDMDINSNDHYDLYAIKK